MTSITYMIKKWGRENTVYEFRIRNASEALLKELKGRYERAADGIHIFVRHLVVECDADNPYNPTRAEVTRNREIVEILLDMGATNA